MANIPVEAVATEIKRKFRMELDMNTIISNCADVLRKMGMAALDKRTEIHQVQNYCVKLEPHVLKVESVTQLEVLTYPTDIVLQDIYYPPQFVPENPAIVPKETIPTEASEEQGFKPNALGQTKGIYSDFIWDCPYVKLNYTGYTVQIETVSLSLDNSGLPLIPEEALNACVYYNVYCEMEPLLVAGKIPDNTFARVEQWKDKHINQGKNGYMFSRLNKNQMDKVFDIMTSFDRKRTNVDN